MKGYGPVNTITSFCRNKCGNFDQNPTASIKSYWEPGYRDTPLFPRLPKIFSDIKFFGPYILVFAGACLCDVARRRNT